MYLNEMELKFYYEMKKEEMEKAISANRYSKDNNQPNLFRSFLNTFKQNITQERYVDQKAKCCNIKTQEVCC